MRQHGRWGLISANRVNGINCFIGVTVGTRTKGAAKHLSPLVPVVTMIFFFFFFFTNPPQLGNNNNNKNRELFCCPGTINLSDSKRGGDRRVPLNVTI